MESEQRQWPVYDLAAYYLLDGALPEVIGVDHVDAAEGYEYRITTRFRHGDQNVRPATWSTTLTMTAYAVREADDWRLANALPRNTRAWRRNTVGPITYVFAPDYPYDSDVKFGPVGGAAQPVNRMIFSGIPAVGEEYRHELAHFVLTPLCCRQTSYFISEGVPTWLGGTTRMDFPTAARAFAAWLAQRRDGFARLADHPILSRRAVVPCLSRHVDQPRALE